MGVGHVLRHKQQPVACQKTTVDNVEKVDKRLYSPKHPTLSSNSFTLCVCQVRIVLPKPKQKLKYHGTKMDKSEMITTVYKRFPAIFIFRYLCV